MTTYTAILATETDPGKPVKSDLAKRWADNVLAMFEGDASASSVRLQDAALDTGAATGAGTTWTALRTAGVATGAVGSYALLRYNTLTTAVAGTTHAGSGLRYSNAGGGAGGTPAGTWRAMGDFNNGGNTFSTTLCLRIS